MPGQETLAERMSPMWTAGWRSITKYYCRFDIVFVICLRGTDLYFYHTIEADRTAHTNCMNGSCIAAFEGIRHCQSSHQVMTCAIYLILAVETTMYRDSQAVQCRAMSWFMLLSWGTIMKVWAVFSWTHTVWWAQSTGFFQIWQGNSDHQDFTDEAALSYVRYLEKLAAM